MPWGAGGGTDATARIIGSLLEKDLGQPVNVVNRTGGSGVVGHQAIATAPPDGYTIGLITVEISMMHWQDGRLLAFFGRPIAATLGALTLLVWFAPLLRRLLARRRVA